MRVPFFGYHTYKCTLERFQHFPSSPPVRIELGRYLPPLPLPLTSCVRPNYTIRAFVQLPSMTTPTRVSNIQFPDGSSIEATHYLGPETVHDLWRRLVSPCNGSILDLTTSTVVLLHPPTSQKTQLTPKNKFTNFDVL